jgi:hypothetical protein
VSVARILLFVLLATACDGQLRFERFPGGSDGGVRLCAGDEDCPLATLHCDVVSGECVGCNDDDDCGDPQQPRCDTALHRCVGCGSDLDCGAEETCLPMTRACATRCEEATSESSCPPSAPTCDENARICVQCQSDADCRAITDDGPYCEATSGRCVHCTDDRQCPATRPRCDRVQRRCGECSTRDDCPAMRACDPETLTCM